MNDWNVKEVYDQKTLMVDDFILSLFEYLHITPTVDKGSLLLVIHILKTQRYFMYRNRPWSKQQIFTFKKLQPVIVWNLCVKNYN